MYSEVRKASESGHISSVRGVLEHLHVSKSGYYAWCCRKPSSQELRRLKVQQDIMTANEDSHEIYGATKITRKLNAGGQDISRRTVSKYMHDMGIHAWYRRPYTVTTISHDFSDRLKNILCRDFSPSEPDAVWCTDITDISTGEGFCYLSCIMDLFSRKIVAWELGRTLETEHVLRAINKAIHTDHGIQYTSDAYCECTSGTERSYSSKGNPWDNACIESFHALIKREWLWRIQIRNCSHAYRLIFEYIDAFYNTVRIHSHCGYMSPVEYEKKYYNRQKKHETSVA